MHHHYFHPMARILTADIILGSPQRDCRLAGICSIEPAGNLPRSGNCTHGSQLTALVTLDAHDRLCCCFSRGDISPEVYDKYFATGYFTVLDAYTIGLAVARKLGSTDHLTILPGEYPALQLEDALLVSLRVEIAVATVSLAA